MKCMKCEKDFEEINLEESHNVPCYLFINVGARQQQKQHADKFGRNWLCKECHKKYEEQLNFVLKIKSLKFAKEWFK